MMRATKADRAVELQLVGTTSFLERLRIGTPPLPAQPVITIEEIRLVAQEQNACELCKVPRRRKAHPLCSKCRRAVGDENPLQPEKARPVSEEGR